MTIDEAKAQAKALRAALQAQGSAISHAQSLELVARQHGAKDWNTLHARLALRNAPPELALGDRVQGLYLGQRFAGRGRLRERAKSYAKALANDILR